MIVIVGESASGKSSVAKYLMDFCHYNRIVTYTTREPRENETDGVDYHFIDKKQFEMLKSKDFFAETAEYNGWLYGSAKKDYVGNAVIVLTPKGLRSIKKRKVKDIFSIYLTVPRRDRLIKCLERGDNIEEAYRRNLSDVGQFDGIEDEVDLVLENQNYTYSIKDLAEFIASCDFLFEGIKT